MATTPVFDPTQPYTEVESAPSAPAKPVFDPTQPYTEVSRRDRLKELEGQIMSSVDAPADVKAKLESDYANEVKAYQDETSLLGRIKDKFQDFDLKTAASKAWDAVVDSTWGAAEEANKRIGAALEAKKKAGEDVGITDVVKAMATEGAKPAAAGAAVGVMDALQGAADIAASGIATSTRAVGDIIGSDALKRFSAELETQRVMKAAEKEKAASDLKAGLGIESESKVFGGGRMAGDVVTPIGIPGAPKALAAAGKASEGVADVVSAGVKKAAGQSLRAASKVPSVLADIATIKAASMMPAPAGLAAYGALAGAPLAARFATNMMSDDSVLGLGKYVKAVSDAMASRVAQSTGSVANDFISNNIVRIDNLTQKFGDWSTDIQRKITAKPKGVADILMKSKIGESIVDNAEKVGADLMSAQDDVISTLQKKLDESGLSANKRSLINAKLDDVSSTIQKELDESGLSTYRRSRINAKMDDVISTLQKELKELDGGGLGRRRRRGRLLEPGLSADKRSLIKAKMDDVISTLQKKLDESGLSADQRSLINAKMDDVISTLQKELDKPGLSAYQRSLINAKLDAAQAQKASIAAGISVVKKLGAAEKITDTASRILADATLGATVGAALASMTATPGSDSIDDGMASGVFYGTLLGTLGRAAIKRAPESTAATVDQPVTPKDLDLIVKSPEYLDLVRAETVDLIKRPADGLEVVDSVPEDAIWVNAPSTVQAMPAKSTGVEVGDSVPKNAPAMLESGRTPKALLGLQPEVGLLESGSVPKALRAPMAEELPLGNTKASAPDMTALRARVEKTQKVIDELSAKDVTEGLTDNELVTLEQAEATIARDVETLKGLEASELTSAKKPKKILAMEKPITEPEKKPPEVPIEVLAEGELMPGEAASVAELAKTNKMMASIERAIAPSAIAPKPEVIVKSEEGRRLRGEVFTPSHIVKRMVDMLPEGSFKPETTYLEPAVGEGYILKEVLARKLANAVSEKDAVKAVASLYGVDISPENVTATRAALKQQVLDFYADNGLEISPNADVALDYILERNIVVGDSINAPEKIEMSEWHNLGEPNFKETRFKLSETAHTKDTTTPKVPKKPRKVLAMEKSATETSKDAGPRKAKKKVLSAAKLPKQEPAAPAPATSQPDSFTADAILKRKTRMTDTSIGDAIKHIEGLDLDLLSPADSAAVKKALESLNKEYDELIAKIEGSGVAFHINQGGLIAPLKNAARNMAAYYNYANDAVRLNTLLKKAKSGKATQQEIEQLKSAEVDTDNIDYEIEKSQKHYKRLSDAYLDTNRFINREGKHITVLSDDLRGIE